MISATARSISPSPTIFNNCDGSGSLSKPGSKTDRNWNPTSTCAPSTSMRASLSAFSTLSLIFAILPERLQLALEHLARGAFGERGDDAHGLRAFEVGEVFAAVGRQLFAGDFAPLP